ncbi:MAG: GNAT family N-acetyltransferase [Sphingomicrobium sp.]
MSYDQTMTLHEGELGRDDVRALIALHFADMRADSPPEACLVLPIDALGGPDIRMLSLRDGAGLLLGVGALKISDEDHGKIKSMRTATCALSRGMGRQMLAHLIALARDAGLRRISLETGNSSLFDAANRLYLSTGFIRCSPFGGYAQTPFTHFYTLALS